MLVLSFLMVSLYDMNEREVRSMALNDNIKKIREEKKYTQQQLADKLYVSRQTVCRWENGSRCPDLITAKKLAMELGVTLDELISDEDITDIQSKYGIWKFDRVTADPAYPRRHRRCTVKLYGTALPESRNRRTCLSRAL